MMAYRAFSRLAAKAARCHGHRRLRFPLTGPLSSSIAPSFSTHSGRWSRSKSTTDSYHTNHRRRAVIFDIGGVIVPSPFPLFARFERDQGLPSGSVVHTIQQTGGGGAWARLERGEITVGEFGEPFSQEYQSITGRAVPGETFRKFLEGFRGGRQVTVVPLMAEVMEKLRTLGVKTAVLTNNFRYDDGGTLRPQEDLNVDVVSLFLVLKGTAVNWQVIFTLLQKMWLQNNIFEILKHSRKQKEVSTAEHLFKGTPVIRAPL